ncbi:MAG TPA: SDR family oxidoreductase [Thermoleophilaceae bacterium]|nr:SDR family oxidoreductase [Thermoleophilaceae bacterium]
MPLSLVTGFPGFIGRRLARKLLDADAGATIVALVEPRMLDAGTTAARAIDGERIEVLCGDITDRRLGVSDADYERLAAEVRRVFHLAAIYDLSVPLELAQRVNVDGTGNVLELCLAAKELERLAYVSTAYVAGRRTGVVYEHELVMGQQFKNHYESTKFQAEVWVREAIGHVPTSIVRPAIVVGDSQTGETQKFDGPYYLLRGIAEANRARRSIPQFGRLEANFNVVPVDYVVEAIAALAADPRAEGQTVHLVDPEPLTSREVVSMLSQRYAGREPQGRIPPNLVSASLRIGPVRERFGGTPPASIAYLTHPVRFDTRRAVDLLSAAGLAPPRFSGYVDAMVEYFKAHEHDQSLKPALAR